MTYLGVSNSPNGVIYQGYNGKTGWIKTPQGQREMNSSELSRVIGQVDLLADFKLADQFTNMSVAARDRIEDHEVYVVEGQSADVTQSPRSQQRTVKLFFDKQTGLLLRRTLLTPTLLELDPEQTDLKDYALVDGLRLPFTTIVSYLDDNHLGTTRRYLEVKHNVPIEDSKFEMPQKQ